MCQKSWSWAGSDSTGLASQGWVITVGVTQYNLFDYPIYFKDILLDIFGFFLVIAKIWTRTPWSRSPCVTWLSRSVSSTLVWPVCAVWPVTTVSYKIEPNYRPVDQFMPKRQSAHICHSIEDIIETDIEDFTNVTPAMITWEITV